MISVATASSAIPHPISPGMSPMLLLLYIIIWCVGIFATLGLSTFTTFQHSSGHLLLPYKEQDFVYIWSPLSIKNKLHTCVYISISVLDQPHG
jgi:hypothetical protein